MVLIDNEKNISPLKKDLNKCNFVIETLIKHFLCLRVFDGIPASIDNYAIELYDSHYTIKYTVDFAHQFYEYIMRPYFWPWQDPDFNSKLFKALESLQSKAEDSANKIEENKKKGNNMDINKTECVVTSGILTPAEMDYRNTLDKAEHEFKLKNEDAQNEFDRKVFEANRNLKEKQIKEKSNERAFKRFVYYKSLTDQGFTTEQAMQILLKEIPMT